MKKILILDDNEDFLEMIKYVLGKKYTVFCIADPGEIHQVLTHFDPDLVMIDHFIGSYNAAQILEKIRHLSSQRSIPIILFSGTHDIEIKAEELGVSGYIKKPSGIDHIREYVGKFLDN